MGLNEITSNTLAQVDKVKLGKRSSTDLKLEALFFTQDSLGASSYRDKFRELQGRSLTERELQAFLEDTPWGKIAKKGTGVLVPLLTGIGLGKTLSFEQTQQLIEVAFPIGLGALSIANLCAANERISKVNPKTAKFARVFAAGKVISAITAQTGLLLTAGAFGGGAWHAQELANAARTLNESDTALNSFFGSDVKAPQPDMESLRAQQEIDTTTTPADQPSPAADWPGGIIDEQLNQQTMDKLLEVQRAAEAAEAARQAALEAATRTVMVNPGDTLTGLIDAAGGDAYGADFTNTVLKSADVLTGPQNPNRDMARALIEFIKTHPGVNWKDAINGVGSLAKEVVGGVPLKDTIAQATQMIYPGQEMKVVVGAAMP